DRTIHHKTAQSRLGHPAPERTAAEQGRSFCSRSSAPSSKDGSGWRCPSGAIEMTVYDDIHAGNRPSLPRALKLLLFFMMQGAAAILVGFAPLFGTFVPQ